MLDREMDYYNANRQKFRKLYENKHIVIVGKKVIGVYDSHVEAYAEIRKTCEVGTFIICNVAYDRNM
jgi:hypothetical protein